MFRVKVSKFVAKYISRLGSREASYFKRRFKKLEFSCKGYRRLGIVSGVEIWELRCSSHRVYYTVENNFVVVDNIEYEGDISVSSAGSKNSQRKDIVYLKNRISKQQ